MLEYVLLASVWLPLFYLFFAFPDPDFSLQQYNNWKNIHTQRLLATPFAFQANKPPFCMIFSKTARVGKIFYFLIMSLARNQWKGMNIMINSSYNYHIISLTKVFWDKYKDITDQILILCIMSVIQNYADIYLNKKSS